MRREPSIAAGPLQGRASGGRWLWPAILALLACYDGLYLWFWFAPGHTYGDFFALWSFARFLAAHPAAAIYDSDALTTFQHALDPDFSGVYPFFYPPSAMLLFRPLASLDQATGFAVWTSCGLALWLTASLAGRRVDRHDLLLILAPTTLIAALAGQNGFFVAALMIGGLRLAPRRPLLGGLLLGLLSFKPQLCLMLPVAMLAARHYRALAAAALAAAAMAGAAAWLFGADAWAAWLRAAPGAGARFTDAGGSLTHMMPTVAAALRGFSAPGPLIWAAQAAAAALAAAAVWRCFRRGAEPLNRSSIPPATFLATPYAFVYDMPMLANAVVALRRSQSDSDREMPRPGENLALIAALLIPALMLAPDALPLAPPMLAGLLGVIAIRVRTSARPAPPTN